MALVGSVVASQLNPTPTKINDIDLVVMTNGIYDELYATKSTSAYSKETPAQSDWDFNTILHAFFSGDLHAGNVKYTAAEVDCLRIKRRKKGTLEWITLFEITVDSADDFHFERFDQYARSHTDYEYALIPVIYHIEGGEDVEGNLNISEVHSVFDDVFISERDTTYHAATELNWSVTKNHPSLVVAPINRKHPFVFGNGNSNYYSGTLSGIWVELDKLCTYSNYMSWDDAWSEVWNHGWEYREGLMEFLCNGRPKILKLPDGRMWLITITDSPTETVSLHYQTPTTSFNWTETDDCESGKALYENNFIDADSNAK